MLPEQELSEKPIKLRNACIFYLGHIPTFLDIQLTKTTGDKPTHPASYYAIFERGIDPDVDNPDKCHDHSEIPEEWPPVDDIVAYQDRVRARLISLYAGGADAIPRAIGRAIWLGFEHEIMHLETLLYMMLQSPKTLPPPHTVQPDFEGMARKALAARTSNEWINVPAQTITIGLNDPEDSDDSTLHFGWYVLCGRPLRRASKDHANQCIQLGTMRNRLESSMSTLFSRKPELLLTKRSVPSKWISMLCQY